MKNSTFKLYTNEIRCFVSERFVEMRKYDLLADFNQVRLINRVAEYAARDYVKANYKSVSVIRGIDSRIHHAASDGDFVVHGRGFYTIPANEAAIILKACKNEARNYLKSVK